MMENLQRWLLTIPSHYRSLDLEHCDYLHPELIKYGYEWVNSNSKKSLYLFGTYGCGKTTFAHAIIHNYLRLLGSTTYIWPTILSAKQLDNMLLNALKHSDGDSYVLDDLSNKDLLFIDDIDKINSTDRFKSQMFEIINQRYLYNRPTIITSNCRHCDLDRLFDGGVLSRMSDLRAWFAIEFPDQDIRKILSLRSLK